MKLPAEIQDIINIELANLTSDLNYELQPERRIEIYNALGDSCIPSYRKINLPEDIQYLPNLTTTDRVRARIAMQTAQKVLPLWELACRETDENHGQQDNLELSRKQKEREEAYANQLKRRPLEEISVYDVPRSHIPLHILEMADKAFHGEVQDAEKLIYQANEWWQIYTRPEKMEREFFVKWAAQEALYEAVGMVDYRHIPPARDAVFAYAGIFKGKTFESRQMTYDRKKLNEFWHWWLAEAIPTAWILESHPG